MTFAQFVDPESAGFAENPDLILKYENRYLSWDTAAPILASLAVYRRSLTEHPENIATTPGVDDGDKPAKTGWGAWWRSGRTTAAQTQEAETASLPSLRAHTPALSVSTSPLTSPDALDGADLNPLDTPVSGKLSLVEDLDLDTVPNDPRKHYAKTLRLTSDQLVSYDAAVLKSQE